MVFSTKMVIFVLCGIILFSVAALSVPFDNVFAISKNTSSEQQQQQQQKPDIKASDIYQTRTIVLVMT